MTQQGAAHDGQKTFFGTAWYGEEVVAVGGWNEDTPGTANGMFVPDAEMVRRHPFVFARSFIRWIANFEQCPMYRRIQTASRPRHAIDRYMCTLGFTLERKLENFRSTGLSYNLWGRERVNGIWPGRHRQN